MYYKLYPCACYEKSSTRLFIGFFFSYGFDNFTQHVAPHCTGLQDQISSCGHNMCVYGRPIYVINKERIYLHENVLKKKKKMLQNTYAPIFEYAFKMCYVQLRKNEFLDLFAEKMMYSKLINYSPVLSLSVVFTNILLNFYQ